MFNRVCGFVFFFFSIISVFLTNAGSAYGALKELSPDAVFKKFKNSVVRIEVTLHGASLGVGSGFFITTSGEIVTSLHVVRPFLAHPESELSIKLASGKVFRTARVGACGDARGVDLCLLKIDSSPTTPLPLANTEITPGESIVAIGHPRGLDFSISTGVVSALRTHSSGWREVQIDAAISPGNSGGPIINRIGQAIGVVYQFERDGQNLNFGILSSEVSRLRSTSLTFLAATEARRDFLLRSKRLAHRALTSWVKPAIQSFTDIKTRPVGMKWMRASLGAQSFLMLLPDLFQNCEKSESDAETASTSCSSTGGDVVITIQKRPRSLASPLASYQGRRLVEARPLALVERLEAEGLWQKSISKIASFTSRPSPSRCFSLQRKPVLASDGRGSFTIRKAGFFQDASGICRFETENDSEPGAVSASQWVEVGKEFYGINIWASDPGRLVLLQGLGDLVIASAGLASDDATAPYLVKLRSGLKRDTSPKRIPIEGDITDFYSDETSNIAIVHTASVPPSQMNRTFAKWVAAVAKAPLAKSTDAISTVEVARHPGRLGMWVIPHPTDRRRTALLMMTASFGPRDSWVIYEIQTLPMTQGNRVPSKSMATDMDRFRSWTQDFEPLERD